MTILPTFATASCRAIRGRWLVLSALCYCCEQSFVQFSLLLDSMCMACAAALSALTVQAAAFHEGELLHLVVEPSKLLEPCIWVYSFCVMHANCSVGQHVTCNM